MARVSITNRTGPCRCGCGGTDPWHARTFKRALRNRREETGTAKTCLGTVDFVERAEARFPFGTCEVVRWTMHGYAVGWVVAEEVLKVETAPGR